MTETFLDGHALAARGDGRHLGKLGHVLNEQKARSPQVHFIAGRQFLFPVNRTAVHSGTVQAVQVAQAPSAVGEGNLGMLPTTKIILEDDPVGAGTPKGIPVRARQGKDVAKAVVAARHQISRSRRAYRCHECESKEEFRDFLTIARKTRFKQGVSRSPLQVGTGVRPPRTDLTPVPPYLGMKGI